MVYRRLTLIQVWGNLKANEHRELRCVRTLGDSATAEAAATSAATEDLTGFWLRRVTAPAPPMAACRRQAVGGNTRHEQQVLVGVPADTHQAGLGSGRDIQSVPPATDPAHTRARVVLCP
jgi:hypothetical protein